MYLYIFFTLLALLNCWLAMIFVKQILFYLIQLNQFFSSNPLGFLYRLMTEI